MKREAIQRLRREIVGKDDAVRALWKAASLVENEHLKRQVAALAVCVAYPMREILERVPGATKHDKAQAIGVSRTCYWQWEVEETRPQGVNASTIATLTGIDIKLINPR
jgi:DNA-binding XRE family transcriptional regulator